MRYYTVVIFNNYNIIEIKCLQLAFLYAIIIMLYSLICE